MLGLCKPKYFIPVHGEYRMLVQHAGLAREMGVNPKNILVSEIGRPIEISENSARLGNSVPAGRLLVDGLGIGDVGTAVLRAEAAAWCRGCPHRKQAPVLCRTVRWG